MVGRLVKEVGQSPVFAGAEGDLLAAAPFSFGALEIYCDPDETGLTDIPHGDGRGETMVHFAIDKPRFTAMTNVAVQRSFCFVTGMFRYSNGTTITITTDQRDRAGNHEGN
jgi:hypothetical protein